jgi:hypothetical protein
VQERRRECRKEGRKFRKKDVKEVYTDKKENKNFIYKEIQTGAVGK